MSFPGYLKSLKLKDKHNGTPESASRDRRSSSTKARIYEEVLEEGRSSSDITEKVRSSTIASEAIRDERQNAPSKSLWVGNIPSRTTSSEIRELFCKFGNIASTRIQLKYAFVNFEDIESAISAFKKYHDKDVFQTGNSTINIRFTSTLIEAKQAKEGLHERQNSMTTKAEAAQKQYFQPIEAKTNESSPKLQKSSFDWPNGKPPTGPKSQRCEVSPPALRRGDSYRPAALSRGSSFRSEEYRAPDTDEYRRGRSHCKHLSPRYSPTYSRSESRSLSRTSSSIPSPKYAQVQRDESPLPWERKEPRTQSQHLVWTKDSTESPELPVISFVSEEDLTDPTLQRTENGIKKIRGDKDNAIGRGLQVVQRSDDDEPKMMGLVRDMADTPVESSDVSCSLALGSQATHDSKSPSLWPIERLRIGNESLRGTSVSSEVATTSSRTSSKKRRCHDCRKPASDLSPVIPCSSCKKRFHSSCGNPRPSSCTDKSQFVCGGCLQQRSGEVYTVVAASSEIRLQGRTQGKVHLVSPPLSLNQDGNVSANLSPRDDLYLLSNENRLEAFFPQTSEDTSSPMEFAMDKTAETVSGNENSDSTTDTHLVQSQTSRHLLKSTPVSQISVKEGLQKKYKYKVVTCKWWATGNCTQPEEGCYYAHERTHVSFPDRKKTNKSWTCYDWLSNRCKATESECRFAHNDTGLHVWRDGRPSFKHVTCFWWSKGSCKWDNESCKFAHEDTGLYSLDPADIWQGGSKFSITRPAESSSRSSLQQQSTDTTTSTADHLTTTVTSSEPSSSQSQSLQSRRDDKSSSSILRPSLKVNTSTQYFPFPPPLTNTQPTANPGTIGALPQTPNDDSPDKAASAKFRMPLSVNRVSQTIPDLPTPEIEDVFRLEHEHRPGSSCESIDRTMDISISHDQVQSRSPQDQESQGKEWQQHVRTSIPPAISGSITDQTRKSITNRSADHSIVNGAPRDPRLQNHSRSSSVIFDPCLKKPFSISSEATATVAPPIVTDQMNDVSPVQNDTTRPRSVGRCQKCQKPVFASLLCRVCSTTAIIDGADLESSPTKSGRTDTAPSTKENGEVTGSKVVDLTTDDRVRTPSLASATTATPVVKNNLKRSASGSNMFLKNKRPKSSMMFSSSGSIRPDSFSRPATNKRPSLVSANSISRRAPQPSLNDLIQKERAKNSEKSDDLLLDDSVLVESPISDREQQNEPLDSPEDEPLVDSRILSHAAKDDSLDEPPSADQHNASVHGDLFSSPSQTPHKQNSNVQKQTAAVSSEVRLRLEAQKPQSVQTKSYLPAHWRSSESPQPDAGISKPSSTNETTSRPKPTERMNIPSRIENKVRSPSRGQKQSFTSRRPSSRDVAARSDGIKWASAITCAQCQKNHKKCLHDNFGALDAHKCREYVLSREGRPDTGRSRSEWNAILKSSELDPSSDDDEEDLLDDEDAHTSGSEDEFTTAVGENEMLVDREYEEQKDLLDKFKQPLSPPTRPSTMKKSPSAISKFFTRDSEEGWTAADERAKKAALVSKGVMFESDSDDDDYLSDDFEKQSSRERFYDPLHVPPKVSRDLFEVAPELDHNRTVEAMLRLHSNQERPSRKQQWAELKSRQFQERREKFGNPHWEVNRVHRDVMVSALVERIVPPKNPEDRFAVGSVQTREEEMTFGEFLGVPKLPEICLMNDGERLGFRDGQKDRDRVFGRTGRGLGKRTTDDEKWPVRTI